MKNTQKFIKFLESMKVHNPALIESITKGFTVCFEGMDEDDRMAGLDWNTQHPNHNEYEDIDEEELTDEQRFDKGRKENLIIAIGNATTALARVSMSQYTPDYIKNKLDNIASELVEFRDNFEEQQRKLKHKNANS